MPGGKSVFASFCDILDIISAFSWYHGFSSDAVLINIDSQMEKLEIEQIKQMYVESADPFERRACLYIYIYIYIWINKYTSNAIKVGGKGGAEQTN